MVRDEIYITFFDTLFPSKSDANTFFGGEDSYEDGYFKSGLRGGG